MINCHIVLPTSDLVSEMMTYEAYFGFYPGGIKAVVRDTFLGTFDDLVEWSKYEVQSWSVKNDVLAKAMDYLEAEEFNLEKCNSNSVRFDELCAIIIGAIEQLRDRASVIVLTIIGSANSLILERALGNRWIGNDLVVKAALI